MSMEKEPGSNEPRKRGRGRPPGSAKSRTHSTPAPRYQLLVSNKNPQRSLLSQETISRSASSTFNEEYFTSNTSVLDLNPSFADVLKNILDNGHIDAARIARAINVTENTVYRWLNGSSEPRPSHLRQLLRHFPQYQAQLTQAIRQTFQQEIEMVPGYVHEVQKEIYQHVLELAMMSQDAEKRFWQIAQAVFAYALMHLDPENLGLSITYARLMPPLHGEIHSLCEVITHGTAPWPFTEESKIYLGSTTLAGTAIIQQRPQVWNSKEDSRVQTQVDAFEKSACAIPIMRDSAIAGTLIFSSTKPDFFTDGATGRIAEEYALLMNVALSDAQFYPASYIHLRAMPQLRWQREQVAKHYMERVFAYARKHQTSRREAEDYVQREFEREFEEEASKRLEQINDE
jgi:transcriptional regulator with XRE-family HTH domain